MKNSRHIAQKMERCATEEEKGNLPLGGFQELENPSFSMEDPSPLPIQCKYMVA